MFLGIDLGTSSIKLILVDENENIVGESQQYLALSRPHPLWSEQDPADWWAAVLKGLDALKDKVPDALAATVGIGLSGQMHGAVLLDRSGKVLRPCILWNDGRAKDECTELEQSVPGLRTITGNIASPGFTAPKLLWVRRHEPDIFARTQTVALPKAYIRFCLSGELLEDMSDASGTLWLDVGRRDWSDTALEATGLDRSHMPALREGNQPAGQLRAELAARYGMSRAPVIAGSAGDNAATAVGLGAVKPGSAFVSLGTSGVLWATTDRFRPNPDRAVHAFCHTLPGLWHQMGVILAAAASLDWWASVNRTTPGDLLGEMTDDALPGDVLFLPYLSGERTPHNDAAATGAFVGLTLGADRPALTRAVLEGVAFAFRDCLDALQQAGTDVSFALATGGGSRSRAWLRILASTLGVPLGVPAAGEHGAALGAARLARLAVTGELPEAVCRQPVLAATVEPDRLRAEQSAERYHRYRALYPALKGCFS